MSTCYNPFTLGNKTILITGASSGIGKTTAIECSKCGATVIITGRNSDRLKDTYDELHGDGHEFIVADINESDSLKNLVSSLPDLDGIVLCAGVSKSVTNTFASKKAFDSVMNTNFFDSVELIRLILKSKKLHKGGSIVPIASIAGNCNITPGGGIYGVSKAALATWSKYLALELSNKRIRVNSVCPGMVKTPMADPGTVTAEQLSIDEAKYPLGRYGNPEDIAYAIVYLLSDASQWVTGTNFVIDGGFSLSN